MARGAENREHEGICRAHHPLCGHRACFVAVYAQRRVTARGDLMRRTETLLQRTETTGQPASANNRMGRLCECAICIAHRCSLFRGTHIHPKKAGPQGCPRVVERDYSAARRIHLQPQPSDDKHPQECSRAKHPHRRQACEERFAYRHSQDIVSPLQLSPSRLHSGAHARPPVLWILLRPEDKIAPVDVSPTSELNESDVKAQIDHAGYEATHHPG